MRKKDSVDFEKFKKYGFKYGTRDRFIYKTKQNGSEAIIYIDLLPFHNENNKIKIACESYSVPTKIVDKLYDLTKAGLVEK